MNQGIPSIDYFCGRDRELSRIIEAQRSGVKRRSGGLCLVSGPPGIGKTWFCQKLLEELPRAGQFPLVLQYRFAGTEDVNDVCAALFRQVAHQRPNDDSFESLSSFQRSLLSRYLPDLIASQPPLASSDTDPRSCIAVWQRCLAEIARREDFGAVVFFDDVHLAGTPVWDFLSGICRQTLVEKTPLWIWAGIRNTDASAGAMKWAAELAAALRDEAGFWERAVFEVIDFDLSGLNRGETGRLLDKLFGAGFAGSYPEYMQWLLLRSSGNPFYLGLLIQTSVREGLIERNRSGEWQYRPERSGREVGAIDDLMARKVMDTLSEPEFDRPVGLAAALGDSFRFNEWRELLGLSWSRAVDLLLSLQHRGILNDFMKGNDHQVRFAHPLLLEAFRSVISRERQRALHAEAAEYYRRCARPVQAMDQALAADYPCAALAPLLRDAAPAAFAQHQPTRILAWAESINGLEPGDHARLLYYALKSASLMGKVSQTIELYDRLTGLRPHLTSQQDVEIKTIVSRSMASVDPQRAMALIDDGLALYPVDDQRSGNLRSALLLYKFFLLEEAHQYQQAIAMSSELLALNPDDDGMAYKVNNTLGLIYLRQGQWDEADRLFRDVVIPAARRSSEIELGQTLENRGAVLARLCRFVEAGEHFAQALAIAEQHLRSAKIASILNAWANVSLRQGQHKKALAEKERAARIAFTLGNQSLLASCLNDIAGIRMEMGEQTGVIELLQRSLRLKEAAGNRAGSATTMNNLAECYLRGSGTPVDYPLALEWAQRANRLLVELGYNANLVDNIVTMSQASLGLGNHGRALEYAEQAVATAERLNTPYNRATALAQKGTVLLALGSEDAASALQEAAALFAEIGNRAEQAKALAALAGYYLARNAAAKAGELAVQAAMIYRELKLEKPLAELIDQYPAVFQAKAMLPQFTARTGGLRIQTLGAFRVTLAGGTQPLSDTQWGSQLGRLMLAYLITVDYGPRQGVDRERILEVFWNDSGAGGSMRVLLHRLRKCLRCREAVLFAGNKYVFNWRLSDVWLDREQMEAHYRRGAELFAGKQWADAWDQLEQAESLIQGRYLAGIDEPWVEKTRAMIADTQKDILDKLIDLSERLGRGEAAAFYRQKREQQ